MIKAEHSPLWRKILAWYFSRSLRRTFFRCLVKGEHHLTPWHIDRNTPEPIIPLIVYCSHGGWWDAALAIAITNGRLHIESYGMMEEKQLKKYRFFTKVGMFSVHRSNARSAIKSLKYASELIKDSRKVLWMFPQGELIHQEIRPIQTYTGMANMVGMLGRAWCVPVAIRYDFLHEQQPEAWLSIGEPELMNVEAFPDKFSMTEHFRIRLTELMDEVRADVMQNRKTGYEVFLQGKTSVEKRWDAVRGME